MKTAGQSIEITPRIKSLLKGAPKKAWDEILGFAWDACCDGGVLADDYPDVDFDPWDGGHEEKRMEIEEGCVSAAIKLVLVGEKRGMIRDVRRYCLFIDSVDPERLAHEWLSSLFTVYEAQGWWEIDCWDPETALKLRDASCDPEAVAAAAAEMVAKADKGTYTNDSPIYAACNGHLDVEEIIAQCQRSGK